MNVRRLLSLLVFPLVAVAARPALAVCMGAQEYRVSPLGTTLIIVPTNFQRRRCPDAGGLLRQNVDTGQVVRIDACIGTDGFLDECVPPGKYRYGLAMPYECCETCCKTEFYTELTLAMPVAATCEASRMPDKPRPMPYTGRVPWGNSPAICGYTPPPDAARPDSLGSRPVDDGGRPTGSDAAPGGSPTGTGGTAAPGTPVRSSQNTGGCSVGGAGGDVGLTAFFLLGGLGLAAGFARTSDRRRRARS